DLHLAVSATGTVRNAKGGQLAQGEGFHARFNGCLQAAVRQRWHIHLYNHGISGVQNGVNTALGQVGRELVESELPAANHTLTAVKDGKGNERIGCQISKWGKGNAHLMFHLNLEPRSHWAVCCPDDATEPSCLREHGPAGLPPIL